MLEVLIKKELCKGCELCIDTCPKKCIIMTDDFNSKGLHYVIFSDKENNCNACKLCVIICPDVAIEIEK